MMNQKQELDKTAMRNVISSINAVDGFDPEPFAVDYIDLSTGESRKRLPVMIQMAWFRLVYPEGKITTKVSSGKDCFVATARIYPNYKDDENCYLAEATASRGYLPDKPSVSPREWAQTAAVGIALRNAGFGLQFGMAGEDFSDVAPNELGVMESEVSARAENEGIGADAPMTEQLMQKQTAEAQMTQNITAMPASQMQQPAIPVSGIQQSTGSQEEVPQELTYEERIQQAMNVPCPIKKYAGRTLGDLVVADPKALNWIVNKFHDDKGTNEAARLICEYALGQASA